MQILKRLFKSTPLVLAAVFISTFLLYFSTAGIQVQAQRDTPYSEGNFNQLNYGTDPRPADEENENQRPNNQNNSQQPANNDPPPGPRSPQKVLQQVYSEVVLSQVADIVSRVPAGHRVILPYYSWILLLLLSLVLLLIAALDRLKTAKLVASIKKLEDSLEEQQNFSRIVLHNLNTPLTITKSTAEMLQSMNPPETQAVAELTPLNQDLAKTINYISEAIIQEDSLKRENPVKNKIGLVSTLSQWYFIVPALLAVIFGVVLNGALSRLNTDTPSFYSMYQVIIAIMVCLIFANAVRIIRISGRQKRVLRGIQQSISELSDKRNKLIATLSESLGLITGRIKEASSKIKNEKIVSLLGNGIRPLEIIASKVEAVSKPLSDVPQKCQISDLVNEILSVFQSQITEKNLKISTQYKIKKPVVTFVPELRLMVQTLVENAVKYSPSKSTINITAHTTRDKLKLTVHDHGKGISKEDLSKLFQPFSRTDDVLTYDHSGMGLSLYTAKAVALRLNGNITITSKKGSGTKATIQLPLR